MRSQSVADFDSNSVSIEEITSRVNRHRTEKISRRTLETFTTRIRESAVGDTAFNQGTVLNSTFRMSVFDIAPSPRQWLPVTSSLITRQSPGFEALVTRSTLCATRSRRRSATSTSLPRRRSCCLAWDDIEAAYKREEAGQGPV